MRKHFHFQMPLENPSVQTDWIELHVFSTHSHGMITKKTKTTLDNFSIYGYLRFARHAHPPTLPLGASFDAGYMNVPPYFKVLWTSATIEPTYRAPWGCFPAYQRKTTRRTCMYSEVNKITLHLVMLQCSTLCYSYYSKYTLSQIKLDPKPNDILI